MERANLNLQEGSALAEFDMSSGGIIDWVRLKNNSVNNNKHITDNDEVLKAHPEKTFPFEIFWN